MMMTTMSGNVRSQLSPKPKGTRGDAGAKSANCWEGGRVFCSRKCGTYMCT